jgi:hypothetical protein
MICQVPLLRSSLHSARVSKWLDLSASYETRVRSVQRAVHAYASHSKTLNCEIFGVGGSARLSNVVFRILMDLCFRVWHTALTIIGGFTMLCWESFEPPHSLIFGDEYCASGLLHDLICFGFFGEYGEYAFLALGRSCPFSLPSLSSLS